MNIQYTCRFHGGAPAPAIIAAIENTLQQLFGRVVVLRPSIAQDEDRRRYEQAAEAWAPRLLWGEWRDGRVYHVQSLCFDCPPEDKALLDRAILLIRKIANVKDERLP